MTDYLREARAVARAARRLAPRLVTRRGDVAVAVHDHAWPAFESFVKARYRGASPRLACLSMNPARHGAVQSGLAFTDAATARELVPGFDALVRRPRRLISERTETSGRRLRAWAQQEWGGLDGLHREFVFAIPCPIAVLRGPRLLNVPLPVLDPPARRAAEAFYRSSAARLVRALRPRGLLLLGDFARRQWLGVAREQVDLARIPAVATHHPAAHITNERKYRDWRGAYDRLRRTAP